MKTLGTICALVLFSTSSAGGAVSDPAVTGPVAATGIPVFEPIQDYLDLLDPLSALRVQ